MEWGGAPPRASIVIRSYNCLAYIGQAIESALAQDYPAFEVVVVDDGSTDSTPEVLERYRGRATILLKPNGGQASAINAGFDASTGAVVMFLDGDDTLDPDALSAIVAAWRPGTVRVSCPLRVVDPGGAPIGRRLQPESCEGFDRGAIFRHPELAPHVSTSGNAFTRAVLERILPMPAEEWRQAPDIYLNVMSALVGPVQVMSAAARQLPHPPAERHDQLAGLARALARSHAALRASRGAGAPARAGAGRGRRHDAVVAPRAAADSVLAARPGGTRLPRGQSAPAHLAPLAVLRLSGANRAAPLAPHAGDDDRVLAAVHAGRSHSRALPAAPGRTPVPRGPAALSRGDVGLTWLRRPANRISGKESPSRIPPIRRSRSRSAPAARRARSGAARGRDRRASPAPS